MQKKAVLLIMDQDELILELLYDILQDEYSVIAVRDVSSFLEKLRAVPVPDGIMMDVNPARRSGIELMWEIRRRYPNLPIIGMSGMYPSIHKLARDCPEGTVLLQKPFEVTEVLSRVREAFSSDRKGGNVGERQFHE